MNPLSEDLTIIRSQITNFYGMLAILNTTEILIKIYCSSYITRTIIQNWHFPFLCSQIRDMLYSFVVIRSEKLSTDLAKILITSVWQ